MGEYTAMLGTHRNQWRTITTHPNLNKWCLEKTAQMDDLDPVTMVLDAKAGMVCLQYATGKVIARAYFEYRRRKLTKVREDVIN